MSEEDFLNHLKTILPLDQEAVNECFAEVEALNLDGLSVGAYFALTVKSLRSIEEATGVPASMIAMAMLSRFLAHDEGVELMVGVVEESDPGPVKFDA